MLIVALIDVPDTAADADNGTFGDTPDTVAAGVLARLMPEAGYADNGTPYMPTAVTVHAFDHDLPVIRRSLPFGAAGTAEGSGPL